MTIISSAAASSGASQLIDITAGSPAHAVGSWIEMISAANHTVATHWIQLEMEGGNSSSVRSFLIDIGTGGSGAESAVISNLPWNDKGSLGGRMLLPLTLAAGTRIVARCRCATASAVCRLQIKVMSGDQWGPAAQNESAGASTTTSRGTAIDPGGVANTKPASPTELIASTSFDYDYWVVVIGLNNNDTIGATSNHLVDIMTGGSGAEVVLAADLFARHNSQENTYFVYEFWHTIPAGTRLSAKSQSTEIDATDRILSVSVHGFKMTPPAGLFVPRARMLPI